MQSVISAYIAKNLAVNYVFDLYNSIVHCGVIYCLQWDAKVYVDFEQMGLLTIPSIPTSSRYIYRVWRHRILISKKDI